MKSRADLDTALLDAHARADRAALIALYAEAADTAADARARAFYLTHAYVFALEAGDLRSTALKSRLVAEGADIDDAPAPSSFPKYASSVPGHADHRPAV